MYKTIIVPVDLGSMDRGEKTLNIAKSLLYEGGQILLLTVVEAVPGYMAIDISVDLIEKAIEDSRNSLAELKQKTGISALVEVRSGAPAREILAFAEEHKADLIIIGSHVPDFSNYLIGATADRVVRHSKCSVLVDR